MREIEFRGKRKDNGEWVYGEYISWLGNGDTELTHFICPDHHGHSDGLVLTPGYAVIPETVGQYTGLKDSAGKKIFEGDIVHILSNMDEEEVFEVIFDYGGWHLDPDGQDDPIELYIQAVHLRDYRIIKIIGNIHDTPELLGRERD
jgi:uncharacterized phage protein (TIGR01671 family)